MLLFGLRVLAVTSVTLYLVPVGAHLFELPGKIAMPPNNYMIVQGIYRGWSLFGIVLLAGMLSTLMLAILRRRRQGVCALSLAAFVCLAATQIIFWVFTYPMNIASRNWTTMPDQFEAARRQWEYSHAASAVLTFLALLAVTASVAADADAQSRTGTPAA